MFGVQAGVHDQAARTEKLGIQSAQLTGKVADMQANHVRCWFAPEDLKIGDRFRDQFASWLGLCPDNRVSGGKVLKSGAHR